MKTGDETLTEIEEQALWEQQNRDYQRLLTLENRTAALVFGKDALEQSVSRLPTAVVCDDERVAVNDSSVVELAIAGSGVLMTDNQRENAIAKMQRAGIDVEQLQITCHDGCGACAVWKQEHPNEPMTVREVEEQAATRLRTIAGAKPLVQRVGYSESTPKIFQMQGHASIHHARVIVLDGTGRLDLGSLNLPASLLMSVRYAPDDGYLKYELEIMASIPMGKHGFRDRFTREDPLLLVVVGDPYHSEGMSEPHLRELARDVVGGSEGRIKLLSFTAPQYERLSS